MFGFHCHDSMLIDVLVRQHRFVQSGIVTDTRVFVRLLCNICWMRTASRRQIVAGVYACIQQQPRSRRTPRVRPGPYRRLARPRARRRPRARAARHRRPRARGRPPAAAHWRGGPAARRRPAVAGPTCPVRRPWRTAVATAIATAIAAAVASVPATVAAAATPVAAAPAAAAAAAKPRRRAGWSSVRATKEYNRTWTTLLAVYPDRARARRLFMFGALSIPRGGGGMANATVSTLPSSCAYSAEPGPAPVTSFRRKRVACGLSLSLRVAYVPRAGSPRPSRRQRGSQTRRTPGRDERPLEAAHARRHATRHSG